MPLDNLLAVIHEFIEPSMSCSALARLLRRRGVSSLPEPIAPTRETKLFKAYEPGYVHIDVKYLPQMQDEQERGFSSCLRQALCRRTGRINIEIVGRQVR